MVFSPVKFLLHTITLDSGLYRVQDKVPVPERVNKSLLQLMDGGFQRPAVSEMRAAPSLKIGHSMDWNSLDDRAGASVLHKDVSFATR